MEALNAAKSATDITSIVKAMNDVQLDTLMKYIYKGMAFPSQFNSANLLSWHEKTLEVAGVGSIVRVLTDRRTV
jgi:actin related protein 2/3 complex subunit 5